MVKKGKNKDRLDKFYYMAKEHGYRSRAAFKLIQLNKKYDFLSSAKCVVDLCAAPGGWLQVAAKYMPMASIKIGVDLDAIKPIKGCLTFQEDITTPKCLARIKKELKHFKADIVLNDGAPNVGADWAKDAYNQAELSLYALKLATEVLRRGGTFITKVFRSRDYNSLLFVFNHLFNKVEASKPQASRQQSAEIFVVCQGFKAPDFIDPKFLDPKYAFAEVEEDIESANKISSLKKLVETKKRNRSGYGDREVLYMETDFMDFLECADPYEFLSTYNKFRIDDKAKEIFKQYPPVEELTSLCEDLKVQGRREMHILLKYRFNYQRQLDKQRKQQKAENDKLNAPEKEINDEDLEAQIDKELEETIKRVEQQRRRADKKEKEKKQKGDLRAKMSVIASTDLHNVNDDVLFDRKTFDKLRNMDIENLEYENEESEEEDEKIKQLLIREEKKNKEDMDMDGEDDSDSEMEDVRRIDRMANEIDEFYKQKKEYKGEKNRKLDKNEKKKKALIEQQRLKKVDESEEDELNNDDVREKLVKFDGVPDSDDEDEGDYDSDLEEERKSLFINPLLLNQDGKKQQKISNDNDQNVSEGEWSSDESDAGKSKKDKKSKKDVKLGKRKKREDEDDVHDFFHNNEIEEVPQDNLEDGYSSMDSEDKAETRALAKLMLRKKTRTEIMDGTYNRYSNFDDPSILPEWFVEDERKHYRHNLPITKEQSQEERRLLQEYNARPSKKVAEAKARKKRRLAKAMAKVKSKAQIIAEQDINEGSKMRQIEKLYKKEKNKLKEEKSYVVTRNIHQARKSKTPRNVKMVDTRMKKDLKRDKMKQRKEKHGKGKASYKGKGRTGGRKH